MSLTEREREILKRRGEGKSDYRIAKELGVLLPSVQRSRAHAMRKLTAAKKDLAWAQQIGIEVC